MRAISIKWCVCGAYVVRMWCVCIRYVVPLSLLSAAMNPSMLLCLMSAVR